MSDKQVTGASALDTVKLAAALAILVGGIAGFYLLDSYPLAVRWLIVLVALAAGIFTALQSEKGRAIWDFISDSRIELRKVVWPTRQETLQTTLVVAVAVLVMGIFFWVLDWLLGALTRMLTGQGG